MGCLRLAVAFAAAACFAAPAAAQTGRIQGLVRDTNGNPIKGASITAIHPDHGPHGLTSATDGNGRFALLGMRIGPGWRFIAEAPGYFPAQGEARVRTQMGQPLIFTLQRDPGPLPGALERDIHDKVTAAAALRQQGRYDQAIAAYEAILLRNPRLTMVNLVLAGTYRDWAARQSNDVARQPLLEKALTAYQAVLKDDTGNQRVRLDLAAVTADLEQLTK